MAEYLPAPEQDVAVTARVRLARNFEDLPFSHRQNEMQGEECVRRVCSAVLSGEEGKAYTLYRMGDMDETIRQELGEHRLITGEMVSARHGAALISSGKNVSVLVNEDDHIRILSILPGMQLDRCAELAQKVDTAIGEKYQMAFDNRLGFLTAFPTDVGTGMRASVLLHLPAVPKPDDTADALAMAITFCHTNGNQLNRFVRRGVGPI